MAGHLARYGAAQSAMKNKVFILGVGCQKGGTTWLHRQLLKSIHVDTGMRKEYHVFNSLYNKEDYRLSARFLQLQERATRMERKGRSGEEYDRLILNLSFIHDTENYYKYFDDLWSRSGGQVTHVGDITPAYAALPADAYEEIKLRLESRGFTVKVIFIMRDPIERCWSTVRMSLRKLEHTGGAISYKDEVSLLRKRFQSAVYQKRTRYEDTVRALEQVFQRSDIFYSLYENLFNASTLQKLKDFLDLADLEYDVNEQVNNTKRTEQVLDPALKSEIYQFYEKTYQFCAERYNAREFWRGYQSEE